MLQAARRRLRDFENVEVRRGELEALPLDDESLDAATLLLVLHHVPDPGAALREAARVLRPGGRLLICDMLPHDREDYRQQMGHVWLGFGADQVRKLLAGGRLRQGQDRDPGRRSGGEGAGVVRGERVPYRPARVDVAVLRNRIGTLLGTNPTTHLS